MFGAIPAFNVTSSGQVVPLTSQQKFGLALKSTIDPTAFLGAGIKAGAYQYECRPWPGSFRLREAFLSERLGGFDV